MRPSPSTLPAPEPALAVRPAASPRRARRARAGAPGASGARPTVVALVSDAIYPFHMGGKEIRYHHVVRELAARGLEVHVFTMRWWPGARHRVEGGVHYHALCHRYRMYRGGRRSVLEAAMFSLACWRLLLHRFDVIEADHMPHLQLFTVRAVARLRRVPLVVTWHEFWGRAYWRSYLGRAGSLAAWIEQRSMRLGDALIAPSPGTAARLVAEGIPSDRVTVAPNGLDLPAIATAEPSPVAFDLLYVGRLVSHKHVDALLEAVASLAAEGRPVTLGVVGEGPERASLEVAEARLGLEGSVRFLGNVPDQGEVFGLMKSARVFVLPSTREGFGIVVAEAIACGAVVVTTDHEDNHARAFVDEGVTGYLAEPTPASLARAVRRALDEPPADAPARSRIVEHLAWPSSVSTILDVFARAGAEVT